MSSEATLTLTLDSRDEAVLLFGSRDQYLRLIRDALEVRLIARGNTIQIEGPDNRVAEADRVFQQLRQMLRQQGKLTPEDVRTVLAVVHESNDVLGPQPITFVEGNRHIRPRTDGQARYVRAMRESDLILCVGPGGTGKTFLAVAMAVGMLRQGLVKRIVLVRPAVEAGERLGFLPGDIAAKVNPYLRPLFDALNDMMEPDQVKRYMENDIIEIAPLAFMRGRAQPLTSQVLTPTGFRSLGMLRAGNLVIGSDGQPTLVLGTFPQGRKEIFRVTMSDGSSTRCCAEHLWAVRDLNRGHGRQVVPTQEMAGRLWCAHQHRFELPLLTNPVEFPTQDVPIDPYTLGLLLGDGCLTGKTTPTFATADRELVKALAGSLASVAVQAKGGCDHVLARPGGPGGGINPLSQALRDLKLWGTRSSTKFVPPVYLLNSVDVRLAVLQGLLDTDGGPVTQQGRTCRIQFTTCSPLLREDVHFLVRSLGGVATSRCRPATDRKPGFANGRPVTSRHDAFILDIRLPASVSPFRLSRKRERYREAGIGRPMRFLHAIEPDGVEETVCIQVAAADSLYVTDDFILTHNTLNQSVIILDEGQNTTVPQMKMFLTRMGTGSKIIVTGDVTQVDLPKQMRSGLADAIQRLRDIDRIAIVYLDEHDIVRHPLVQQVVKAYEEDRPRRKKE
jgi:phosphate starvation-inducible PhoH-like protein